MWNKIPAIKYPTNCARQFYALAPASTFPTCTEWFLAGPYANWECVRLFLLNKLNVVFSSFEILSSVYPYLEIVEGWNSNSQEIQLKKFLMYSKRVWDKRMPRTKKSVRHWPINIVMTFPDQVILWEMKTDLLVQKITAHSDFCIQNEEWKGSTTSETQTKSLLRKLHRFKGAFLLERPGQLKCE